MFLSNVTCAIIKMQPSNVQSEHWIMIANFCHKLCFGDSLRESSFLKQQYKQMMPELLQFYPSVRGYYTIYAVFHHFKFQQGEATGVHNVSVLSFLCNHKQCFFFFDLFVQVIQCFCYYLYSLIKFFNLKLIFLPSI